MVAQGNRKFSPKETDPRKPPNQRKSITLTALLTELYLSTFQVWLQVDFEEIHECIESVFPYSHFFDNGIIGSGTCIFSKVLISDATFHEFTMNGYPHKFWHGDWFGGKGLGVCQINYKGKHNESC